MRHLLVGIAATVLMVSLWAPSVAHAQTQASEREPYKPLVNGEMSRLGLWEAWVAEFGTMTGRQKAEVYRRHVKMCLESFEMTGNQRALVAEWMKKHVTDEAYGETDPDKRRDLQFAVEQDAARAEVVLGQELYLRVFFAKPPISVLIAVKNDPAFR